MATAAAAMDATVACHVIALAPLGAGTPPPPDGTSLALELVVELPEVVVFVYVEFSYHMYESPTSPSPISSARTDADDASASVHRSAADVQIFMVSDRAWGFLWGFTKSDELKGSVLDEDRFRKWRMSSSNWCRRKCGEKRILQAVPSFG